MIRTASCTCGQLRIEVEGEPRGVGVSHCLACQSRTGSVFAALAGFAPPYRVFGEATEYVRTGDQGARFRFRFCPVCGTNLFHTEEGYESAYVAVAVSQALGAPLPLQILAALVAGGVLGLGVGYLSVRLRGIYYSIATIAVAVILEAVVVNWPYVGGAQGLSIVRPAAPAGFANYTAFVFVVMAFLAITCVAIARGLERSRLGLAFGAIRDNEMVAEACGVPTLRTKCIATAVSGALMAAIGAPYALYASYIDPSAAFNMNYSLLALAMALLGGTLSWPGPVIGALVLSLLEQGLNVTVSPELNLLFIGLILVGGVVFLPGGLYRLLIRRKRPRRGIRAAHRRRTA